jgi:hypothetical protein
VPAPTAPAASEGTRRRSRRAPGPPVTYEPPDSPTGGRRRARPAGADPAERGEAQTPDEAAESAGAGPPEKSWAGETATAAELSSGGAVGEGYAAARAARRMPTPAARLPVQPDQSSPTSRSWLRAQPPAQATPTDTPEPQAATSTGPIEAEPTPIEDFSDLRPEPVARPVVDPEPLHPSPLDPATQHPARVDPAPQHPARVDPAPIGRTGHDTAPAHRVPPDPAPVDPAPVDPEPSAPALPKSAPAAPAPIVWSPTAPSDAERQAPPEELTRVQPPVFEAPPQPPRVTVAPAVAVPAAPTSQLAAARTQQVVESDETALEEPPTSRATRATGRLTALLVLLIIGGAGAAGTRIADAQGWISSAGDTSRIGAMVATWAAIVLLTQRCGGRVFVIGAFSAALAVVVGSFPEEWALAGAATSGAVAFGLLGMVLTRPQRGLRTVAELVWSASIGLVGAVVVSGYDVVLRPYRFRILVLSLVLVAALALAWRLGQGRRSIGRRGGVVIVFGVLALAASVAYAQAIRSWGSPGVLESISDFDRWLSDMFGASPRPVEALVGFPLLVWGVAYRRRNRQGWWMCAFGALGAAGITSSLIQTTTLSESLESTAYSVLIGAVVGLAAIGLDRVLTGGGGRKADASARAVADRQEPARFDSLL